MELTFGLRAEGWVLELLVANGYQATHATEVDDKVHKVDFWVAWKNGQWLAIQFSVDRQRVVAEKGRDALRRGICPSWLNGQELEAAMYGRPALQKRLVAQFWEQVEAVVAAYPYLPVRRPAVEALYCSVPKLAGSAGRGR